MAAALAPADGARHDRAMKWLVRFLAVVGACWLLWTGYALATPETEDQLPRALLPAPVPEDIDLVGVVARHLNVPVTTGNTLEALINGDEIFPAMLDAVERARRSVRVLTYVYWTGDVADRFADALVRAAGRGVNVRVVLDGWGARKMDESLETRMREAGVHVAWFHPLAWSDIRRINHRTHRKIMVVDDEIAFVGGVGIAEEWTGNAAGPDEWRDDHFRVTGPAVRWIDGSFAENWLNASDELLLDGAGDDDALGARTEGIGTDRIAVLSASPRGDVSPIALTYWAGLRAARASVDIATPYFVPDPALLEAIEQTARRGVRVRLLVPGSHADKALVRLASRAHYPALLEAGVEVHEFQPTMLHVKAVLIDERWSIVGSANFDNRSFELNDEIALLTDSGKFAARMRETFEADLERSTRLDSATRSGRDRLIDRLSLPLLVLREQL